MKNEAINNNPLLCDIEIGIAKIGKHCSKNFNRLLGKNSQYFQEYRESKVRRF